MRRTALNYLFPILLAAFLWLLITIVLVPVETGDAYPKYSTLRADPLGSKIVHDALSEIKSLRVERNYKQPSIGLMGLQAAIFHLGVSGPAWESRSLNELKQYESMASSGSRLIFGFAPALPALDANFEIFDRQGKQAKQEPKKPFVRPIIARWGVQFHLRKAGAAERARMSSQPRESALYFEPDASWQVIGRNREGKPAHIEKPIGNGAIVLVADTFAISNEGLKENPKNAALLSPLIGSSTHVIFDENHLGIAETGSIGSMIRRYKLQGSVAILLVLGLLFIWRNGTSLLPAARTRQEGGDMVPFTGRDSQEGLATLLRRSIPASDVGAVCIQEWRRAIPLLPPVSDSRLAQVEAHLQSAGGKQNPAALYRKVQRILHS
jgi:hypothetical protein